MYRSKLNEKLQESLAAVLPILAIVLILSFTIAPLPTSVLMAFLFGAVLLPRRGAGHVADGRARGRVHHQDAQGRHHADARLSAGLSHHHFRAGPAGARQSGAGRAEYGAHRHRGGRRGIVSLLRHAAYAALRPAQHDAGGLLHRGLCSRHVRAQGFPCRSVRLRRRDDRPDDRAVHHGDGRRRFRHPKR